jgi:hypothetical protein
MKQGFVKTGNMYSLYTADKHGDMVFCGAVCVRKAQLRSSQEYIENYSVMKFDALRLYSTARSAPIFVHALLCVKSLGYEDAEFGVQSLSCHPIYVRTWDLYTNGATACATARFRLCPPAAPHKKW